MGMDHGAEHPREVEDLQLVARNARSGMKLFLVYLALYLAFVLLSAFSPKTMEIKPWAGINLSIWYGFGLIVAALILALVYSWICRVPAQDSKKESP